MTTFNQVQQIVRPLLERNADLALVRRIVVIKPVQHILRGISIGRTSSADDFRPIWATVFLFEPDAHLSFNWGAEIYSGMGSWLVDNPLTSKLICAKIEEIALPLLRPVQTIEDFVAFTTKERFPSTPLAGYRRRKIYIDLARGDFDSAREYARITCATV